jgi:V-type H+-transporting ATPase subunit F
MSDNKNRSLIAVIGDEDTITGMLLAGVGQVDGSSHQKNFFVVDGKTTDDQVDQAFGEYVEDRDDIAILLINQHIAERIRFRVDNFTNAFPAVLEIPSKEHPYGEYSSSFLPDTIY